MRSSEERDGRTRARGDEGTALVEFALVSVLLLSIVYGIIHYGLILSFKQDFTRAAAEGARAGAVAYPAGNAEADTREALTEAIHEFGGAEWEASDCANPGTRRKGFRCEVTVGACPEDGSEECVIVELHYDYDGDGECDGVTDPSNEGEPLFGVMPILGGLTQPGCISANAVARTNA